MPIFHLYSYHICFQDLLFRLCLLLQNANGFLMLLIYYMYLMFLIFVLETHCHFYLFLFLLNIDMKLLNHLYVVFLLFSLIYHLLLHLLQSHLILILHQTYQFCYNHHLSFANMYFNIKLKFFLDFLFLIYNHKNFVLLLHYYPHMV